ncbi:MAG: phosphinothricin acetyltransferase [Fimbriimonadales bacterium]|nr:MAG: phosphinothricin acetyltransferase [Fimbriimonadales bacterium]
MRLVPARRTPTEYAAMAEIWNAQYPDLPETAEEFRDADERRPDRFPFARYMVVEDDRIIGYLTYGQTHWCYHPRRYHFTIQIASPYRRRGCGSCCLEFLETTATSDGMDRLLTSILESHEESQAFLTRHGFALVQRNPISELNLQGYDLSAHRGHLDRALAQGIRFVKAEDLVAQDPSQLRNLYHLACEVESDTPQSGKYEPPTFEDWVKGSWEAPTTLRESWIVTVDGDQLCGYTVFAIRGGYPKRLGVEMTGVARAHRRRGIASALKYLSIQDAIERGAEVIVTDNEESNPMFQINLTFGFVPKPAWATYEKLLRNAG